jgi:hypothetical protein
MARDDWRIRIELPDEEGAQGLLERLGLARSHAEELADELRAHRLAVSQDADTVFVYAATRMQVEQASRIAESELDEAGLTPTRLVTERWLEDEERWDDEPPGETWEESELEQGHAPWEVRVECASHSDARALADRLERDGYPVERRWRYLIAGASSKEDAEALAARVHGEVEPGGGLVWETVPGNPFAVFGGLGGSGTPVG